MNYTDLRNRCQQHWLTRGPDLEGEGGWCLLDGRMYYWSYFYGESEPQVERHCAVADFVQQHWQSGDLALRQLSEWLQSEVLDRGD